MINPNCKRWLVLATCVPLIGIAGYVFAFIRVSSSADESIRNAERLLATGQAEEARHRLRWVVWFQPDHPGANLLIGQSHLESQEYDAAILRFESVKTTAPEFGRARQNLAGCLLIQNQLEKAELVLRQLIQISPQSLPVHRELAVLLLGQLRSDEAIQVLLKTLESADELNVADRLVVLRDLLKSQFLAPFPEDCVVILQAANSQHPGQTTVAIALADCLLRLGRQAEAANVINQLQDRLPSSPIVQILQLQFMVELRNYEDARSMIPDIEQTLTSTVNESPYSTAKFYLLKSTLEEHDGDYHAAIESLQRAATVRPLDRPSRIRHARMIQRTGRTDSASELFETIHHQAEAELALWHLTGKVLDRMPSREECEKISGLFETLEKPTQSNAWRRVAEEINSATNNVSGLGSGMPK
ncbi:MAG: tetratricopeptide repeat protein [Planctomycetales bacterium]